MPRPLIAHILFSAITSGLMSGIVCAAVVFQAIGWGPMYFVQWLHGWLFAWPIGFSALLLVGPTVRRCVFTACGCPLPKMQVQTSRQTPGSNPSKL
ncbi:DUF2798 domain-containing protein [Alphaproteobacteria bacterium KMM 3653]|uniref:DUF2798 domain-containing protein n=1 Tax=Harenicola maris TaxID=2841044 RepID=A0AAP2CRR7_9RHOB|nr:DUF2798 domain-containing protein [Harenicola maris]